MAPLICERGLIFAPICGAKISLVDLRDIAAQIGATTGRELVLVEIPAEARLQAVSNIGFPLWQAEGLIEHYAHYARSEPAAVSLSVSVVTGRAAPSFSQFPADHKSHFTPH
jgi:uncharacterized protein YbjT (DUF2867 family)